MSSQRKQGPLLWYPQMPAESWAPPSVSGEGGPPSLALPARSPPTYSPERAPAAPPSALYWRASNTMTPQPHPASGHSHPGPHTNISQGCSPLSHLLTASHPWTCSLPSATPPSFPSTGAGVHALSHDNLCKRRLLHSHVSATSVRQQSPNPPHVSSGSGQDPTVPRAPSGSIQHHADMRDR